MSNPLYSAFPRGNFEGLNKLEYFAARAPQPQPWFKPDVPQRPNIFTWEDLQPYRTVEGEKLPMREEDRHKLEMWWRDPIYDLEGEYKQWGEELRNLFRKRIEEQEAWDNMRDREFLIQWPWAWAEMVLRANSND